MLTDRNTLSGKQAKRGDIMNEFVSIKMAMLFVDFLRHTQLMQAAESECAGIKEGYQNWTCCNVHRLLKSNITAMKERARELDQNFNGFSITWWRQHGFNCPDNMQVVD